MSSCSLNITLNSWVSEQACLPLSSPVRACVCSVGSKGLLASFVRSLLYMSYSAGFLWRSFFDFLRKDFSSSSLFFVIIRSIINSLHCLFHGVADYRIMFLFRLQHPLYQFLTPPLPIGKIVNKCPDLMQGCFRKHRKHFFDMVYFANCCIHKNIIAQAMSKISQKMKSRLHPCHFWQVTGIKRCGSIRRKAIGDDILKLAA